MYLKWSLCWVLCFSHGFAGNDLVNFIGVPLAGFSAYTDFMANGNGNPMGYLMDSLNGPATTPFLFLF